MPLKIEHQEVNINDLDQLSNKGFVHLGAANIEEMQRMQRPFGSCKSQAGLSKRNICGFDAGISAGFLLDPREAFYDVAAAKSDAAVPTRYEEIGKLYPIIRSKQVPTNDAGTLPHTLAGFWSEHFKYHKAIDISSDKYEEIEKRIFKEIDDKRPVLINIMVTAGGLPSLMPDNELGLRTIQATHWVVIVGYNNVKKEWLIRDNGGINDILKYRSHQHLFTISYTNLKRISNNEDVKEDIMRYATEEVLPIYLEDNKDPNDKDGIAQLKEDFNLFRTYNIIVFEKK